MSTFSTSDLIFEARDGVPLVGTLLTPDDPVGAVLVGSATGVLARFYAPFAEWLASERRLAVLAFDYRGIGRSLAGKLKDCDARKQDWGERDLPAALDTLESHVPRVPLYLIGHSAGGQLVGLMDNITKVARIVQIASSSGYLRSLTPSLRWRAYLLMHGWMRLSNTLFGYAIASRLGWGEDLPRHVARQWTEWCSSPGYVESSFGREIERHYYNDIRVPLLSLSFTDDRIATAVNVDDMLRLFPNAAIVKRRIAPVDFGLSKIDHVGFFRRNAQALWPLAGDFLANGGLYVRGDDHSVSPRQSAPSSD